MDYPLINGHRYSFASIELTVNGRKFLGFREINYRVVREPGVVRGAHPEPLGYTRGEVSYEADVTLYAEEARELLDTLGDGYMEVPFDIVVAYAEEGQPVVRDRLLGCTIRRVEMPSTRGTDPLEVRFELQPARILLQERAAVKNPLAGQR